MAVPLISGCTVNAGSSPLTQTCNFYETNANGSPSEISSPVTNQIAGTEWHQGYSAIDDFGTTTLSDIIIWTGTGTTNAQTGTLYSCDDGTLPGNCNVTGLTLLGTGFEDANGNLIGATKNRFNSDGAIVGVDTLNVYSGVDVPEPFTLSLFGAGLAGAAAMRRRKAKA